MTSSSSVRGFANAENLINSLFSRGGHMLVSSSFDVSGRIRFASNLFFFRELSAGSPTACFVPKNCARSLLLIPGPSYLLIKSLSSSSKVGENDAVSFLAVLRTIPVEIGLDDVQSDLVDQGLEPIKVSRMTSTRTKKPLPLVLVEVPKDKGQIFQLKTVCHLLISVERPHKKGTPSQCHKCQHFHHSQRHCHTQPKCVKCGGSHESRVCQKTCDGVAKCANCGCPHTASFRGCPRFPRGYLGRQTPRETLQNPPKNRTPASPAAPAKKSPPTTAPPPHNQRQRPPTVQRTSRMQLQPRSQRPQPPERPPQTKSRDQKSRLRLAGRDSIVELHRGDPQEGARDHAQSSLKLLNASAREG
jgi:hypothetical protein